MLFNSWDFAWFLVVVLVLHWTIPSRYRNLLLLVASYVFYGAWDVRFLGLIWISTAVDYVVARAMAGSEVQARRRALLAVSLAVNFSILGFFKYFNFFVESGASALRMFGLEPNPTTLKILLPVGISFYTFQTVAYTIDVFREDIEPEENLKDFALFVAFFPQLVAGPIERASRLLPQIKAHRSFPAGSDIASGVHLIAQGLFRKIVIADGLTTVAVRATANAELAGPILLWFGMVAFMLRFYGDFAGYTDIARGTARLLGVELVPNFEQPMMSRSFSEFWQRWHVSLSHWLADYVYLPLRRRWPGRRGQVLAVLVTMVGAGLWHGASWVFVLWGLANAAYLMGERVVAPGLPRRDAPYKAAHLLPNLVMFHLAGLAFILIQAGSVARAVTYWSGFWQINLSRPSLDEMLAVIVGWAMMLAIDVSQRRHEVQEGLIHAQPELRGVAYAVVVIGLLAFGSFEPEPFIYFQF